MTEPEQGEKVYYTDNRGWKGRFFFRDNLLYMMTELPNGIKDYIYFCKSEKWCAYSDHPGYLPFKVDFCNTNQGDIPPANGWNIEEPGFFKESLIDFHFLIAEDEIEKL